MPELPEVETLRRGVEQSVIGKTIRKAAVPGRRSVRRQSKASFARALSGRTMTGARRKGKYLLIDLDDGAVLVVHLRMSGQLRFEPDPSAPKAPHTHVLIDLADGTELRFVDPRTFGEMFVSSDLDESRVPHELAGLGIDPVLTRVDGPMLEGLVQNRRVAIKALLLAQKPLCGIGNIYADEICFVAGVRPDRLANTLSNDDCAALAEAISSILKAAIEQRGSSLKDERYRDLAGELGGFQESHAVYDRTGLPCVLCGAPIQHTKVAGRSAHFCSVCQS